MKNMSDTAVMLCGHGSRDKAAIAEFTDLARTLSSRFTWPVAHGFLEFATPVIREGLDRLRDGGAREILAVPGMLFAAGHVKNDIPGVLNTWSRETGIRVRYGRDLGHDMRMIKAAGERVEEAIRTADATHGHVAASDTLLVVVGRGSSDPDANANVARVTRLLTEGLGLGWGGNGLFGCHVSRWSHRRLIMSSGWVSGASSSSPTFSLPGFLSGGSTMRQPAPQNAIPTPPSSRPAISTIIP